MATVAERWLRFVLANVAMEEVIYVGIFLPPMSKQRLLRAFPAIHPVVYAHHITLWHFRNGRTWPDLPWGKSVDLKIIGHFSNAKVQAVAVDSPSPFRPHERVPHITISTMAGVSPATSNALIPGPRELEPARGLVSVRGLVGWVDSREKVHFEAPPVVRPNLAPEP
jgi:hypothetical protein